MSPLQPSHLGHALPLAVVSVGLAALVLLHPRLSPLLLAPLFLLALLLTLFQLRRYLRRSLLLLPPLTPTLQYHLLAHPLVRTLSPSDQTRLLLHARYFLAEHTITGISCEVTDPLRAIVAANACLLTLHLPFVEYDPNVEILLYPTAFDQDYQPAADGHQGLFHEQGPILLSIEDLHTSLDHPAENPALHEFVHALDFASGHVDGLPPSFPAHWQSLLHQYARDPRQNRRLTRLLPPAAHEDEGEFLAYLTEIFFALPWELRTIAPNLYAALSAIYLQEPHLRFPPPDHDHPTPPHPP